MLYVVPARDVAVLRARLRDLLGYALLGLALTERAASARKRRRVDA